MLPWSLFTRRFGEVRDDGRCPPRPGSPRPDAHFTRRGALVPGTDRQSLSVTCLPNRRNSLTSRKIPAELLPALARCCPARPLGRAASPSRMRSSHARHRPHTRPSPAPCWLRCALESRLKTVGHCTLGDPAQRSASADAGSRLAGLQKCTLPRRTPAHSWKRRVGKRCRYWSAWMNSPTFNDLRICPV